MKTVLQIAATLALISAAVLLMALASAVAHLEPEFQMTLRGVHASANETALTMRNVREATLEWKKASQAQAANATETTARLAENLRHLDAFLKHTDRQLNEVVLPQLAAAVAHQDAQLTATQTQARASLEQFSRDSATTLDQSKLLLSQMSQDATDPAIHLSLQHIEALTANAAGTAKNLQDTTAVLEKYTERLTKPASMLKQIALGALQYGFQLRGLLGL